MPITPASPIYERMGKTYTSYAEKERKSDVKEQLAAIDYQITENRRKLQDKLMLIQQVSSMGSYIFGNIQKQRAIDKTAGEMGLQAYQPKSIWDFLKTAAFGYDASKKYYNPDSLKEYTARDVNMISSAPDSWTKKGLQEHFDMAGGGLESIDTTPQGMTGFQRMETPEVSSQAVLDMLKTLEKPKLQGE